MKNIKKKAMKRIPFLLITSAILCQSFSLQSREDLLREMERQTVADSGSKMSIIVGDDKVRIDERDSSVSLRIGNRSLDVLESSEGKRSVDFRRYDSRHDYDRQHDYDEDRSDRQARHFRGHWSGIELGFNNFAYNRSMDIPPAISYMELDANRSVNLNVNFSQLSIGFCRYAGFVTGIGLNWNNYRFEGGNSIGVGESGIITEFIPGGDVPVKRSKLATLYLNAPFLLEVQIPAGYSNHLNIAAGFIGGLKVNAWTKIVYEDGEKTKDNGDYNLNLLRGGVTARIGYQNFMLYGTYYLTPWFQELKGPEGLNPEPFEIGVAFTFND